MKKKLTKQQLIKEIKKTAFLKTTKIFTNKDIVYLIQCLLNDNS